MDAVSYINQNLDIMKVLEYYNFQNITTSGNSIRACCAIHGGNNKTAFVFNRLNNLWYCHTGSCGGGDAITLVQKMENVSFPEAVQKLSSILGICIENMEIVNPKESYKKEIEEWIRSVKRRQKRKKVEEYMPNVELLNVKEYRGFKEETLNKFNLKYVKEFPAQRKDGTSYTLKDRLYIPIIFKGKQVAVTLRKTKGSDFPKWSHQPYGFNTGDILYNYDAIKDCNEVIVVEGVLDVWRWYEAGFTNVVCTFGAHLTEVQEKLLLKTGVENIILCYDGDDAGRIATAKAKEMLKYKANVYIIDLPEGKDPDKCLATELIEAYNSKRR